MCSTISKSYILDKIIQNKICSRHQRTFDLTKIINVFPGFTDTPLVKEIDKKKINPIDLAELFASVVNNKNLYVKQIVVDV
jgi:hypothetical protein